ncbi:MAG: phage tail tape measure protein [Alphaproteobacteria bacterium]|jgi:TP901 family phage tail tape measure protein|nr:phage tail tape measure protein [Alphaproteobacteria bacterium]
MSRTQTAVSVLIGAELGASFRGSFGSAQKQLGSLGNAIKTLDNKSSSINAFRDLKKETLKTQQEWKNASQEANRLAKEISKTDKPSKTLQTNFRKAKKSALISKTAFIQNRNATRDMSFALKKAGVDTSNLIKVQKKLNRSLNTLRKSQTALNKVQNAQAKNLSKRAGYRSQMLEATALGAILYGMTKPAIVFESAMADVKKVVDFESPKQLKEMQGDIKALSREIPLSLQGLTQIVAAGGQLGIPREHLKAFAETAAKMSVAFDVTAEEAGESMAKLSNVLKVPINEIGKVGDVINHLSNNMAATAPAITEITLRAGDMGRSFGLTYSQISALGGTFAAFGKTPEVAGQAINMMVNRLMLLPSTIGKARKSFNELGISMSEYTNLIRSGKSQEAMLMVLESLKGVESIKRTEIMKNIFGANAQKHVNSLVLGLDEYKKNLKLVANETDYAGSMQAEFEARSATAANNIQLLKNRVSVLGTNIGTVLLPALNSAIGIVGGVIDKFADFAEANPVLTKYLGLAVVALISFKIATIGVGYAMTFVKAPFLAAQKAVAMYRTTLALSSMQAKGFQVAGMLGKLGSLGKGFLSIATGVIPKLIMGIRAVGLAFMANPIGLIIGGIALGAALIIRYWKPLGKFFGKLFAPAITSFKIVFGWITNLWDKAKNIFKNIKEWLKDSLIGKAWSFVFGGEEESKNSKSANDNSPVKIGSTISEEESLPANVVNMPTSSVSSNSSKQVNISASITINAAEGMNEKDIAEEVARQIYALQEKENRRKRAVNYD